MTDELHKQDLEKFLAEKQLNDHWKKWVRTNLDAGCDKNGMFRIMIDEGFSYEAAKAALNFEPAIPVDQIINPLKRYKDARLRKTVSPFIPNAVRQDVEGFELYVLDDFLNEAECDALRRKVQREAPSTGIALNDENDPSFCTRNHDLGAIKDTLFQDVDRRICSVLGLSPKHAEPLQAQFYEAGQIFHPKRDFFEADDLIERGGALGQRSYSFVIYLEETSVGGGLHFPEVDHSVPVKRGRAVIWNNLFPDGTVNDKAVHLCRPVEKGCGLILKKIFRTENGLPVFKRLDKENVPNYTTIGFERDRLPKPLLDKIMAFYRKNFHAQVPETVAERFIKNAKTDTAKSSLIQLPKSLEKEIQACLKPVLEIWSGLKLEPTFVYGIRVYHHGTALKVHRDRNGTHIIGVIINIDQEVTDPWPLRIEDNYYRKHDIFLEPGDVIYYEATRLAHGRPQPFNGKLYTNIFSHFKIADKS
ncbi:2OG-Fe(II) oxygenase [Paremcibacter congregatus]|uniref:2OG-Fe(II) oxygenase n=1 Tax=Paremcibacter congregatus TaxID=2043170 RepID=UPI0030EB6D83|tara:strand:- start:683 stop:2104 length:1422 start_codon:yes stop_codon:yes gene_type:complete